MWLALFLGSLQILSCGSINLDKLALPFLERDTPEISRERERQRGRFLPGGGEAPRLPPPSGELLQLLEGFGGFLFPPRSDPVKV
jgi:hypothetical protein